MFDDITFMFGIISEILFPIRSLDDSNWLKASAFFYLKKKLVVQKCKKPELGIGNTIECVIEPYCRLPLARHANPDMWLLVNLELVLRVSCVCRLY